MPVYIPGVPGKTGTTFIKYSGGTVTMDLTCYVTAFEIAPSTEDIDVGVFCAPSLTDQGRTTYSALIAMLWEPALYTVLQAHVGEQGTFYHLTSKLIPIDVTQYVTFDTRYAAQPWGRFEVGQRVEVELPLAVLTTPAWVDVP